MPPVSHVKYAFLAAIAASATLSSSVFAQRPKNPPPDDCPNDNPECKCPTDDAVENGCVLISLDLGRTTPWTGSDSVKLKIRTTKASPSLSTPSQLKLVLGYSFMYVGSDLTAAGAPRFVFFAQSAGRTLSFQFADGSSVGIPSPGMYGESKTRLQMVDAEGWATLSNPAFYDLYPGDGSVYRFSASPAAPDFGNLVHRIDPRGVLSTWEDMGVTVLRDAAGNIRQVSTRTRLADVQTLSDTHYSVTVYPLDAEPETDPDTGLLVPPQWNPTRVLDVSQGSSPLELLVGFQKGTGDIRQYRYVEQNGEWTLVKPSGLVDSKEIFYSADETGARRLHLIRSPEGELLRRTEMNFASTPWGWAMTNRIEGIPGDATRTTSWSFYEEGPNRGEIREKITPTGNRILYEYDAQNRVVHESMPLVDEETLYSYEPVDPSDPTLLCDTRPRCIVKKMQGVEIQRTYYVYGTNGVDVIERVGEQGAAYGGTNVLRTVTTYYPVTGAITDGLVQSVRHEDGTIDNYAYDLANGIWTETVTHVHEQAPDIVPMRTTRSVRVFNALGQLVDSRTDLCTIGVEDLVPQADWTPIERLQYAYDVDGNEIRREDLAGRLWTSVWAGNCCGKVSETDWQGDTKSYAYDEEGRIVAEEYIVSENRVTKEYSYDALGQLVSIIETNRVVGVGRELRNQQYDALGQIVLSQNLFKSITYSQSSDGRTTCASHKMGNKSFTNLIERDVERRIVHSILADTIEQYHVYGPFYVQTRQAPFHGDFTIDVQKNYDMYGRIVSEKKPAFGEGYIIEQYSYDKAGFLVMQEEYHFQTPNEPKLLARQFFFQGPFNEYMLSADDLDLNGRVAFEGADRIRRSENSYLIESNCLFQVNSTRIWNEFDNTNSIIVNYKKRRITPDSQYISQEWVGPNSQTLSFKNSSLNLDSLEFVESEFDASMRLLSETRKHRGRLISLFQTTPRIGTNQYEYGYLGHIATNSFFSQNDQSISVYDHNGRPLSIPGSEDSLINLVYDGAGEIIEVYKNGDNPSFISRDAFGRIESITNETMSIEFRYEYDGLIQLILFKSFSAGNAPMVVSSNSISMVYDPTTRLPISKANYTGDSFQYEYTPDGRIVEIRKLSGSVTYQYDEVGRCTKICSPTNEIQCFVSRDGLHYQLKTIDWERNAYYDAINGKKTNDLTTVSSQQMRSPSLRRSGSISKFRAGLDDDDRPRPVPLIIISFGDGSIHLPPYPSLPYPDEPEYPPESINPAPSPASMTPCPPTPEKYTICHDCDITTGWGRKQNLSYINTSNGCGPFSPFLFGAVPGEVIPDNPTIMSGCSFTPACDFHDCCYGWCGEPKNNCDEEFHQKMLTICRECTSWAVPRNYCFILAWIYTRAVANFGDDAYASGQEDACEPCYMDGFRYY